jgi:serine/threonine-protein kinase
VAEARVSQRFLRCPHCGLPHPVEEPVCSITGRPLDARRAARASEHEPQRVDRAPAPAPQQAKSMPRQRVAPVAAPEPPRRPMPSPLPPAPRGSQPPPFEDSHAGARTLIGQVLGGKFRAVRILGEGGMGTVYECEHLALGRRVAVKVLHPAQARKKASVQRFHHEAHVAGAIGHPNICEIYDVGELEDGSPFLVMELLQGETLADRIASEGALPFEDIIEIVTQVLSGLVAAHEKGIIHRDIKPENVFLTQRTGLPSVVKLLDFGISKVAGADDLNLTRTGMVMGTPFYMSPEQARGDRNLDRRVDLYATGVVTYECLTGRRPFNAANYNALLVQILTTNPRPPSEIRPAIPDGFEAVVARAMSRDREKRYQTAAEFQRELSALREPAPLRRAMPASIPPEPVPLVTPRHRKDVETAAAQAAPKQQRGKQTPEPASEPDSSDELLAISLEVEQRDLLDSALNPLVDAEGPSVEIPIVAEAPVSAREIIQPLPRGGPKPPPIPKPSAAPPPSEAEPPMSMAPGTIRQLPPESRPSAPPRTIPHPPPSLRPPPIPRPAPAPAPAPEPAKAKEPAWKPPPMPPRRAASPSRLSHPPSMPPPSRGEAPSARPTAEASANARPAVDASPRPSVEASARPSARPGAPSPSVPPGPPTDPDAPSAPAVLGPITVPPPAAAAPRPRAPEKLITPTPTPIDFSKMMPDAPYLDEEEDEDPTEVGMLLTPATLGAVAKRFDPDATDRIEISADAMAAAARRLDDRAAKDRAAEHAEVPELEDEDEAPTTLFDRKELRRRPRSNPKQPARAATTERAPPPLSGGLGRSPSVAPPATDVAIPAPPSAPRVPRR